MKLLENDWYFSMLKISKYFNIRDMYVKNNQIIEHKRVIS